MEGCVGKCTRKGGVVARAKGKMGCGSEWDEVTCIRMRKETGKNSVGMSQLEGIELSWSELQNN